ncbi:poly-beta-1,6-N-acetyl-D-glucosamine biosynthesis protein PgaD [Enterobacter sp. ECC-175]|uniref:poly-beta-1,6-N-acetyl-D-glucosamine biosynthesis protein PgaD n=1 Tax=Enterobacter sp. ECC-175 TaxID=3116479 RepID=UPI003754115A
MSENTLILTEHRLLPRLFDAALTLLAWGGFLFFLYANLWIQFTDESNHRWGIIIASFNTVLIYLLIAALNGWLLILWYQYNRRRAHVRRHRRQESLRHEELARSFNVSPQIISEMSQYNLLTVYHDQIGRIIDLKINEQQDEEER